MSLYYILDADGCLAYSVEGGVIPSEAVLVDFDIGQPPTKLDKFHFATKQWIQEYSQEKLTIIEVGYVNGRRIELLQQSDWTQLPDVPLETKQAWATYRQALRDITTQEGYPFNVIWPTPPQG
jgi:hypothetical protein